MASTSLKTAGPLIFLTICSKFGMVKVPLILLINSNLFLEEVGMGLTVIFIQLNPKTSKKIIIWVQKHGIVTLRSKELD